MMLLLLLSLLFFFPVCVSADDLETVFLDQGEAVAPRCGRVLMFPTSLSYVHAGRTPISNPKYNIITFVLANAEE